MSTSEIIVALSDVGVFYDKFDANQKSYLYLNSGEIPENGIDDDGNGFIDDVTGPASGPASNAYYRRAPDGFWHGTSMTRTIVDQVNYAENELGVSKLNVSVMPIDYYFGNAILDAVQAGARVVSISAFLNHAERQRIADLVKNYDVIIVTSDRDNPNSPGPGDVGPAQAGYDNFIEVGLISTSIVRGTEHVDLLAESQSPDSGSESVAVSSTAGKIAAIWAVNPSLTAPQVVALIGNATSMANPIIQQQGLSSEMGGEIDFDLALSLAQATLTGPGTSGNDSLDGTSGADALDGLAGNDSIDGGRGNDTLDGGADNDLLFGDAGDDLLIGGSGDDSAYGGAGADTIDSGSGNDFVRAGSKDDSIDGGLGDDTISGEADNDTVNGGEGNDRLNGNTGDDLILGGTGDDTLWGQNGDDTLDGGAGSDVLQLHTGSDTLIFDFNAANDGDIDLVRDIDFAEDTLILRSFGGNAETTITSAQQLYNLNFAQLTVSEAPDGSRSEMVFDDGVTTATIRLFGVDDPSALG